MTVAIADVHLREKKPQCRTDNFWEAQEEDFRTVLRYCSVNKSPLLIAGDLTDTNPPSEYLKRWLILTIKEYSVDIYAILGQHDMENHSLKAWQRTGLGVLDAADVIQVVFEPKKIGNDTIVPCHFGQAIPHVFDKHDGALILLMHKMVVQGTAERNRTGFRNAITAQELCKNFSEYDLIITGDNHEHFIYNESTTVCNIGSMQIIKASQANHQPVFFVFSTERGSYEFMQLSDRRPFISREHIKREEGDDSLDSLVTSVRATNNPVKYRDNLEAYCETQKVKKSVRDILMENLTARK
jgi:DNA repair exonuclease SbcCD nuclease subunit